MRGEGHGVESTCHALRQLREPGQHGRQRPEILYGRRKMTAWLRRNGFPDVSKHTVDRLMRDEGMAGLTRGRQTRTTVQAKDAKRAEDLLKRNFSAPHPNHSWVTDFTYVAAWSGPVSRRRHQQNGGMKPGTVQIE